MVQRVITYGMISLSIHFSIPDLIVTELEEEQKNTYEMTKVKSTLEDKQKEIFELEEEIIEEKENTIKSKSSGKIDIDEIITKVAAEYEIPEILIKGVIQAESNFEVKAVNQNTNGTTDRGIMQLNSGTAPWLAKRMGKDYEVGMEFDPEIAIRMGALYLKDMYDIHRDVTHTLTAYNRGPSGAEKWYTEHGHYNTEYSNIVKEYIKEFEL